LATPGDFAKDRAVSVEICLGTAEPGAEVRPLENTSPVPIAATMALEMIADARHRHQRETCLILTGQCFDLAVRPSMR